MDEMSSGRSSRSRSVDTDTSDEVLPSKPMARRSARFRCAVCGDKAAGYNFGAIVCESCKSFYRRHAHRRPHFKCSGSGSCALSKLSRPFCAACRLRKCFAVGMRIPQFGDLAEAESERENRGVTSEQLRQRRLLTSRLVQRIAKREHTPVVRALDFSLDSECDSGCSFEELYKRVLTGAVLLFSASSHVTNPNPNQSPNRVYNQGAINSDGIHLVLSDYISAMRLFPEIQSLEEPIHNLILSDRLLAQVNLLVIFSTSPDVSGWSSVDATGSLRYNGFSEFVDCLLRDGVDAQRYVESFQFLAADLRGKFDKDWPVILMTLCLLDYFSFANSASCPTSDMTRLRLIDIRRTYEFFLKSYLERYHEDTCESLYRYCTDQFPWTLARLVDTQVHMLSQLLLPAGDGKESQFDNAQQPQAQVLDKSLSLPVAKIFEPVVLEVAKRLSK